MISNLLSRTKFSQTKNLKKEPGAIAAATEMALIHNCFIRILNCIYLQAPNVREEKDIADFIVFMHAWIITIHEHHSNEEKFFFPWLEEDIGVKNYMVCLFSLLPFFLSKEVEALRIGIENCCHIPHIISKKKKKNLTFL